MLDKVLGAKRKRLAQAKQNIPLEIFKNRASLASPTRSFRQALLGENLKLIAEIKKASPSLGDIRPDLDVARTASEYEKAKASAISVLTEQDYFKGGIEDLMLAKDNVRLPILRKDFIFEPYQIYESRCFGADALLLIAAILGQQELAELVDLTLSLQMEPLVEVHTEEDLAKTLKTKAKIIGINNRDLKTFKTDLKVTEKLIPLIGKDKIVVSESGIKSADDIKWLKGLGVDAILVGESIVKSGDIKKKVRELVNASNVKIKICGLTNYDDAIISAKHGADYLGFIFYTNSPRFIEPASACEIIRRLPDSIETVGVFVNPTHEDVENTLSLCNLDYVQLSGHEEPGFAAKMQRPVIKAFHVKDESVLDRISIYKENIFAYLLDAYNEELYGGTGQGFDLAIISGAKFAKPVFLSGGLNKDNVADAIKKVQPFAVDACSGVEKSLGEKDHQKLEIFIKRAKK